MSSHRNERNTGVHLPAVLAIGFTGHRALPDEAASRKLICDFLAARKAAGPERLCGVSSVAAGADLLFAESCLALEIPLRVLLPLSRDIFRNDFDAATWMRAEQVMARAISVELAGTSEARDECYYECGLETVQRSGLLLALWNGQPAQGLGGTEQIITFARHLGKTVVWIHSVTGAVQPFNDLDCGDSDSSGSGHKSSGHKKSGHGDSGPRHSRAASELNYLNHLKPAGTASAGDSPTAVAEAWLAKLDANAVIVAPQVRRLAALPIVLTALAAFVTGSAVHMSRLAATWVAVGAFLGLLAAALPAALRLARRQAIWVRIRTAAEVSRSVLALWPMPGSYQIVGPESLPELSAMIQSLNYLKSEVPPAEAMTVDRFKQHYLEKRLLDQKNYFSRQATQAADKGRHYRAAAAVCTVVAILLSTWAFAVPHLLHGPHPTTEKWLPLCASALFQLATIAGALVVVHDCARRERRYRELQKALAMWQVELEAMHTWPSAGRVVNRVERALIVELMEWRALLQNMKMPRI